MDIYINSVEGVLMAQGNRYFSIVNKTIFVAYIHKRYLQFATLLYKFRIGNKMEYENNLPNTFFFKHNL